MEKQDVVVRSRFSFWLGLATCLICAIAVVWQAALGVSGQSMLWIPAVLGALAFIALVSPAYRLHEHHVDIDNPLVRWRVPYGAITDLETRFGFRIFTPRRALHVWSAPAPNIHSRLRQNREAQKGLPEAMRHGFLRGSDLPTSDSGDAMTLTHARLEHLRAAGALNEGARERASVRGADIAAVAVAIAGVVVSVLVAQGA